jgi:transcriptional antiterminator RfaH
MNMYNPLTPNMPAGADGSLTRDLALAGARENAAPCNTYWYAVNTHPHSEKRAQDNLNRQGWTCFCPLITRTHRVGRRLSSRPSPLFPGYLFVSFDPSRSQWRSIDSTFGVRRIVKACDTPTRLPAGIVEAFQAMLNDSGEVDFSLKMREGARVQFTQGPFAHLIGTLEHLDRNGRVTVLLDILGRVSQVKASAKDLFPIDG